MPQTWDCVVTFENPETAPPQTFRVTVAAGALATAAARAIRRARKAVAGRRFESVLVRLERTL